MYMDDIKLFAKNEKRSGNSNTHSKNIQSGHRNGIFRETIPMQVMKIGK